MIANVNRTAEMTRQACISLQMLKEFELGFGLDNALRLVTIEKTSARYPFYGLFFCREKIRINTSASLNIRAFNRLDGFLAQFF
jgi:hypothetical protein